MNGSKCVCGNIAALITGFCLISSVVQAEICLTKTVYGTPADCDVDGDKPYCCDNGYSCCSDPEIPEWVEYTIIGVCVGAFVLCAVSVYIYVAISRAKTACATSACCVPKCSVVQYEKAPMVVDVCDHV